MCRITVSNFIKIDECIVDVLHFFKMSVVAILYFKVLIFMACIGSKGLCVSALSIQNVIKNGQMVFEELQFI